MSASVGIIRAEKVKKRAGLRARDTHNRRLKTVANADSTRTTLNRNLRPDLPEDVLAAFDQRHAALGNPKLRKNGVLGIEYVMTFSHAAATTVDSAAWTDLCLQFVENRHGRDNVLSARLHADEKTPHVHVVVLPELAGAIIAGPFLGSPSILVRLQDKFHAEVSSKFGLARNGDSPSGRKHLSPAALRAESAAHTAALHDALSSLESIAHIPETDLSTEPIPTTNLLTSKGRELYAAGVRIAAGWLRGQPLTFVVARHSGGAIG